jgi:Icc-related predicted phosphoesterase
MDSSITIRIAHFSDTHGLPRKHVPDEADVIVITGDICPNSRPTVPEYERVYQEDWFRRTALHWKSWAKGKPVLVIRGNHDYTPAIARCLREAGVRAYDAEVGVVDIIGFTFHGLPDIPFMGGGWANEYGETEIAEHIAAVLDKRSDVVLGHAPPYGVLDDPYDLNPGYRIGSTAIVTALSYHEHEPLAYLCGHCHERGGKSTKLRSTMVVNAAATRRMVTLTKPAE